MILTCIWVTVECLNSRHSMKSTTKSGDVRNRGDEGSHAYCEMKSHLTVISFHPFHEPNFKEKYGKYCKISGSSMLFF